MAIKIKLTESVDARNARLADVTTKQFDALRNDLHANAQKARAMAVSLDGVHELGSKVWHSLADRLFDALAQADHMGKVVTQSKA